MTTTNPPVSRTNDPDSSHMAEDEINQNGSRIAQQKLLLNLVKDRHGLTSKEMTQYCNLDRYQIARRLADLKNGNLIYQGTIRKCSVGNRNAVTWYPVEQELLNIFFDIGGNNDTKVEN